jgi:hypothetical protein
LRIERAQHNKTLRTLLRCVENSLLVLVDRPQ